MEDDANNGLNGKICKIIFGFLFFMIIAGTFIQCTKNAGEVTDVIIDNPY